MAENQPRVPNPAEMLEPWRQMAERLETQWNGYFNQMMGTDSFANMLSAYMQGFLNLQQAIAQNVERSFQTLNVAGRSDLTAIAERIAALETHVATLAVEQRRLADAVENLNHRRNGV